MADLYFAIGWKVKPVSDKLEYLAEMIAKQNVEGAVCFIFDACGKMRTERDKSRNELLIKKRNQHLLL